MSRHRIVRSQAFQNDYSDDDYSDDDHEIDSGLSDRQASQYMFDRSKPSTSIWGDQSTAPSHRTLPESDDELQPELSDEQRAVALSCIDQIRDIVGDKLREAQLLRIVVQNDFDVSRSIDAALNAEPDASAAHRTASSSQRKTQPKSKAPADKGKQQPVAKLGKKFAQLQRPAKAKPAPPEAGDSPADGTDGGASAARATLSVPKAQATRNVRALFEAQRGVDAKPTLHLVVVGHVDAGKSTLMGHTLLDLGAVTQRAMHKYETESQKIGKSSFMYAWVLDETGEERERGITMDVGSVRFETPTKSVTLLDAPGHKDFIPNMISGTTQADVALLVVDATRGEFETGFEQGGQTREHAILVRSLGVSQLAVVVNKLDTVGWSQRRFDEIIGKLKPFLQQVGFRTAEMTFVPCSGLTGVNLVRAPDEQALTDWYSGPTLAHVIDSFKVPPRNIEQPFRMTINDIFRPVGSGFCLAGRIETGALAAGDKVLACPLKEPAVVKAVMIDDQSRPAAFAGDHVTVLLNGLDLSAIQAGSLLCDIQRPVSIASAFQARIVVFSVSVPLTVGSPVLLHHQSLVEPASIGRLKALLHKQTGEVLKKSPRCLGSGACALIVLQTSKAICVETFAECKELGRVTLRIGGVTVAAGVITKVLK